MNLLKSSRIRSFNRGDTVFREGDFLNNVYIIREGEFSVSTKQNIILFTKKDLLISCFFKIYKTIDPINSCELYEQNLQKNDIPLLNLSKVHYKRPIKVTNILNTTFL